MSLEIDPMFKSALREALIKEVASAPRRHRRLRLRFGGAVLAGSIVVAGGVAVAAGVISQPGGNVDTPVASVVTATRTGSATIELGVPPARATHVSITLTCLTPGTFRYPDGSSLSCSSADVSKPLMYRQAVEVISLHPGQQSVTIATSDNAAWSMQATYINRVTTPWGVNSRGESYGVTNKRGVPDLVAVQQHGLSGYVKASDLACASGADVQSPGEALAWENASRYRNISISVYASNGTTVVGQFVVGSASGSAVRTVPISALPANCIMVGGPGNLPTGPSGSGSVPHTTVVSGPSH